MRRLIYGLQVFDTLNERYFPGFTCFFSDSSFPSNYAPIHNSRLTRSGNFPSAIQYVSFDPASRRPETVSGLILLLCPGAFALHYFRRAAHLKLRPGSQSVECGSQRPDTDDSA
jgi:hypothetical protein